MLRDESYNKYATADGENFKHLIIIIIIRTFVTRAVSANILNLRRRQSLGEEDGGSEV